MKSHVNFAQLERGRYCKALMERGPDAPTVCNGWTTGDLVAHSVIREHRPDAMVGLRVARLAGHTANVQRQAAAEHSRPGGPGRRSQRGGPADRNPVEPMTVAQDVVRFTDRLTRMATLHARPAAELRDVAAMALLNIPMVGNKLARTIAELDYR